MKWKEKNEKTKLQLRIDFTCDIQSWGHDHWIENCIWIGRFLLNIFHHGIVGISTLLMLILIQ